MTQDDFNAAVTPLARHGLTLVAGLMAAHGFAVPDPLMSYAAAAVTSALALGWSYLEKNKMLATAVAAAPISEVEQLASTVAAFRAQGASPVLVVHLAQVLTSLAASELTVPEKPTEAVPAQSPIGAPVGEVVAIPASPTVELPPLASSALASGPFQVQA